jgi:uncharacterized membrane protein
MNHKRYKQIRAAVVLFTAMIVAIAVNQNSYLLAAIGVITGMLFMILVRSKTKISIDEREKTIREKAAQMTYAIFAPTIGIGSFLIIMLARGEFYYLESLGMVLAYLTLFLIALYAISYHFISKKYGGGGSEK